VNPSAEMAISAGVGSGLPRRLRAPAPGWELTADVCVVGSGVAGLCVALHARADSAASLSGRPGPSQLGTVGDVDRDTNLSRGFYVAAAVLAATGGGLLFWDLSTDSVGLQTHF